MNPYLVGLLVPILLAFIFRKTKSSKRRGLPVDAGGEPGYAVRNARFTSPVETAWEGVSTIAGLFEISCKKYSSKRFLGYRDLVSKETEVTEDGRSFEKLHLGDYQWVSYGEVFDAVLNFSSGLVKLGHKKGERAAIFADTRAEWLIALQVTIYLLS